jgi:hypothetical protein
MFGNMLNVREDLKFVVIRNFLDQNTALLLYQYCKNKVKSIDFKYMFDKQSYSPDWDGHWKDSQVPHTYSNYSDIMMDTVLELSLNNIQHFTGLTLNPNYAYWRLYKQGDVLERHVDRYSCEISTTVCLGYDVSNVDQNVYPNYNWAIVIKYPTGEDTTFNLYPVDMLIYRGVELEHWRDKFIGLNHAQVFFHYSDVNGTIANKYDGRPILGIPSKFKLGD